MPQNLKVETILLHNNAHNISLAQFCDYFKALTSSTHTAVGYKHNRGMHDFNFQISFFPEDKEDMFWQNMGNDLEQWSSK